MKKIITLLLFSALCVTHISHAEEFVALSTLSDEAIHIHARYTIKKAPSTDKNSDHGQPIPKVVCPIKIYEFNKNEPLKIPIRIEPNLLNLEKIKIICDTKSTTIKKPTAGAYLIIPHKKTIIVQPIG